MVSQITGSLVETPTGADSLADLASVITVSRLVYKSLPIRFLLVIALETSGVSSCFVLKDRTFFVCLLAFGVRENKKFAGDHKRPGAVTNYQ